VFEVKTAFSNMKYSSTCTRKVWSTKHKVYTCSSEVQQ